MNKVLNIQSVKHSFKLNERVRFAIIFVSIVTEHFFETHFYSYK